MKSAKRAGAAVVFGWLAMGFVVMSLFLVGPLLLGLERVFEPGVYRATTLWIAVAMVLGLLGGIAGGSVAAYVGRGRGPVLALAALMLVSTVAIELLREPTADPAPAVRPPDQSVLEALNDAREHGVEPLVTRVTNPIVGLLGLWLGASLTLRAMRRRGE